MLKYVTDGPIRDVLEELDVAGEGENVDEVEEDGDHGDGAQVPQGVDGDVIHLSVPPARVRLVHLVARRSRDVADCRQTPATAGRDARTWTWNLSKVMTGPK